jgi:ribosomal protein S18 acetylase RimI-like enzyme
MTSPVRLATPEDAADVARLLVAFRDWTGRSEPSDSSFRASVERIMASPDSEYLLAGDPALGVCQLRYRHSVWTASDDCLLEDLYVSDEARGRGYGRALVEAAFERARSRGCKRVELDANEANTPAIGLYEALGFYSYDERLGGRNWFMRKRL